MDNGAMKDMKRSHDIFETLVEWDSKFHMVLGDKSQLEIGGLGVVPFRMERGLTSCSRMGRQDLGPEALASNGIVLGVREHGLYRLTGKPVDHGKKQVE